MAIDHCILMLGAMKCGTTSLYQYLEQHPDIASSPMKEPLFFSSDEVFARGRAWYESLYPDANRSAWTLDGSTDCTKYPFCGDVPARMLAFGGEFRLIYIMRNPLRRVESHARHAQLFGPPSHRCSKLRTAMPPACCTARSTKWRSRHAT